MAAGLKLTASVYAPAAAIGIMVTTAGQRQRLRGLVRFTLGWAAAFLVVWGPWAFRVYRITGNPLFPYFNSVFRSAWLASDSGMLLGALPKSWLQVFFYPFFWTVRNNTVMGGVTFRDPRFAIAMSMGLACGMLALYRWRLERNQQMASYPIGREAKFLLVFVVVGYFSWQTVFSILRYAVTMESLLGTVITVMAYVLCRGVYRLGTRLRFVAVSLLSSALLSFGFLSTSYPEWGRVAYGATVLEITPVKLPPDSMILSLGLPTAYLAPFIAQHNMNARFALIAGTPLAEAEYAGGHRIAEAVAGHRGPLYSLAPNRSARGSHNDTLAQYHLQQTGACTIVRSNIGEDWWLCRLRRRG